MANQSARELLSRLPVSMANGGDPSLYAGSQWAADIESEAIRRARETGTVDQYYANLLATEQRILDELAEDPSSWGPEKAYNAIIESGVSIKDALNAGVKQSTIDAIFASGAPLTAAQLGGTTGSAFAGEGRLAGVDRDVYAGQAKQVLADFMADDYISPEERRYAQQVATTQGLSLADIASVGVDPNILFNIPAAKEEEKKVVDVFPQTPTEYVPPTVYQPIDFDPSVYAPGEPALDVAFRESAPRTEVTEDIFGKQYLTGFDYVPAAKLLSATGSGFSWTPPTVTSRPRSLMSTDTLRRYTQGRAAQDLRQLVGGDEEAYRAFEPLLSQTGSYGGGLSRSQLYALMRQQASQQAQQEAANYAQFGTRFGARPAGTTGYAEIAGDLSSPTAGALADPMTVRPIDLRYDQFAEGGEVKKPEGYADGGSVPGTDVDPLQQQLLELDRQAMEQELRARQEAPSAEDQATRTESRGMLERLNQSFFENVTKPVIGSALDMTVGLGDLAQLGVKKGAEALGMETKPFVPVAQRMKESAGVEGYDPYSPAAVATQILPFARGQQAATVGTASAGMLQRLFPNLGRETAAYGGSELAAAGARELMPDSPAAEFLASAVGGMGTDIGSTAITRRMADDVPPPTESSRMLEEMTPEKTSVVVDAENPLTPRVQRIAEERTRREQDLALMEGSSKKIRKTVKIDDLARAIDEEHVETYGRKLDPTSPQDQQIAAQNIANNIKEQMAAETSGAGWYDADIEKTYQTLSQIPGLESLANNDAHRIIWSAMAAPTSIGLKVNQNAKAATAAMLEYLQTGKVPTTPPAPGAVTQGISGAGWGPKGKSVASGMKVISKLIEKYGEDGFADWWLSPHTLKEMTDIRKEAGLSGAPSGLSGGKDSMHLGAMILGDKTGRFSLNINGYEGTTKDVWYSRSYNRAFGQMFGNTGEVQGGPRNQTERRQMEDFNQLVLDNIGQEGLSEADAQAILWFYEQGLYSRLGVPSRPGSFSEGVEDIYGTLGVRPSVRGSDGVEAQVEPSTGLEDYRTISGGVRAIRDFRRADARRNNGSDIGGATGPYSREVIDADGGDGLLNFVPDPVVLRQYEAAGNSLPAIKQVDAASSAEAYNADMASAMSGRSTGAQVEIKSAEDLSGYNLFRTEAGSGFAIKPDGDIVAVFASPNEPARGSYAMLQAAVQAGGRKLDAFDTYLPKIYESVGFRPVARLPWNDEFAPPNWDKNTFREYNNGEPDIVFFVHDPEYFGGAKDVPVVTDYDDAVRLQDEALRGSGAGQAPGAELTLVESITPEQREAWRNANKGDFRQTQTPELADAARDLDAGKISIEDYAQKVKELRPIELITEVPKISSFEEMAYALDKNKVEKGLIGLNKEIPDGTLVGSRLDIPAYNNYDTWVVSVHEGTGVSGKSMGYGKVAVLDDVKFNSNPDAALGVATGKKDKAPFARMNGKWRNMDVEEARSLAEKYLNDPEWTQVGMNPYRHSFFYDKNTGMPVDTAEQVIQIGPLVLAKKATTRPLRSPEHMLRGSTAENPKYFKHGGNVERMTNDNRKYI